MMMVKVAVRRKAKAFYAWLQTIPRKVVGFDILGTLLYWEVSQKCWI